MLFFIYKTVPYFKLFANMATFICTLKSFPWVFLQRVQVLVLHAHGSLLDSLVFKMHNRKCYKPRNSELLSGLFYIFSTQDCNAQPQQKFLFQFYLFQLAGNFGHCLLFGPDGSSQCFLQGAEDKVIHPQAEGQMAKCLLKTCCIQVN